MPGRDLMVMSSAVGARGRIPFLPTMLRTVVVASLAAGVLVGAVAPAPVAVRPVASSMGLADCLRSENPTVHGYATGAECPPEGFPYEPVVDMTKAGLRAMDPYTNGCSKSRDTGPVFNFKNACATHDYLADLQRYGAKGVPEAGMDNQFLLDMKADCRGRNFVARKECEARAYAYRAFVQQGDYATGDSIDEE